MAERKEAPRGKPLSKTTAQREYSHMRKAITDRNRRQTQARVEETKRRKAEERAARAREAAEARRLEEEERERLRQEDRRNAAMTTPTRQSAAADEAAPTQEVVEPRPRSQRAARNRNNRGADDADEDDQDEVQQFQVPDAVHPAPRVGNRAQVRAFQQLMEEMVTPDENATPTQVLAAMIQNQLNLANQNAAIMNALQSRNEVNLHIIKLISVCLTKYVALDRL